MENFIFLCSINNIEKIYGNIATVSTSAIFFIFFTASYCKGKPYVTAVSFLLSSFDSCFLDFAGNKAKGSISERVFQENKACQIFRKMNISYPLIRTRTYVPLPLIWVTFELT